MKINIKVETTQDVFYHNNIREFHWEGGLLTIIERVDPGFIPSEVSYPASNVRRFTVTRD